MRAPDGTEFTDRAAYRKYLFLTHYTFKDREGEILRKLPGDIDGQPFDLTSLRRCEVALLDRSEAVQVDELTDCRVFVAACMDSVFVRNCTGCVFTLACKQLRTRDCKDCVFRLYCKTEPIIETSHGMVFGPFNGAYVGHAEHLQAAGLTTPNLWFGVYDFNDEAKTGNNWRLLNEDEQGDAPWRPLNDNSEVAVPITLPGSVPLPSKKAGGGGGGAGGHNAAAASGGVTAKGGEGSLTMAFSFSTSASEAEAAVHARVSAGAAAANAAEDSVATDPPAVPGNSLLDVAAGAPLNSSANRGKIGWDPSRLSTFEKVGDESSGTGGTAAASTAKSGTVTEPLGHGKAKIGWDSSRVGIADDPAAITAVGRAAVGAPREKRGHIGWDVSRVGFSRRGDNDIGGHEAATGGKRTDASNLAGVDGGSKTKIGWDPSRQCATTAGQPAAAGGGGGGAAPSVPQQQGELEREVAAGVGGRDLTTTLASSGRTREPLLPLSSAGPGERDERPERPPQSTQQQQQQLQPEARLRLGWDPTRISAAAAVTANDSPPYTTQTLAATAAPIACDTATAHAEETSQEVKRTLPTPTAATAAAASTGERKASAAPAKIGWNASRVGNPAIPAPTMNSNTTVATVEASADVASGAKARVSWDASRVANPVDPAPTMSSCAGVTKAAGTVGAEEVTAAKPRIGWNASRVGNPTVPAPVMSKVAPHAEAGAAEVAMAVTAAVAVAGRTVAVRQGVGEGAAAGEGGVARRREVPLQLRAVLLYASTQRGIDLRKWFNLGGGGDESGDERVEEQQEHEGEQQGPEGGEVVTAAPTILTMVQFELVLAGLAEGLKAGLSEEEIREIDAAVSPGVVTAAAAAAVPADRVEQDAALTGDNGKGSMVDIGRLLDLCGLAPSPPPPRAEAPGVARRRTNSHTDEVADCSPRLDLDVAGVEDSVDEGFIAPSRREEHDGSSGRRCHNPEGGTADVGVGDGGGWGGGANERSAEVAAMAVDENALRRVTHQADLYGRLLASLGLKQPIECSNRGAHDDWEASLRASTVSLRVFRRALDEVGLQLSSARAMALATRACGPLGSAAGTAVNFADAVASDSVRRDQRENRRPNSASGVGTGNLKPRRRSTGVGVKNGSCANGARRLSRSTGGGGSSRRNLRHSADGNGSNRIIGMSPQRQQLQLQQQQRQERDKKAKRRHEAPKTIAGGSSRRRSRSMPRDGQGPHSLPSPPSPARRRQSDVTLPAWDLRRYLVRLRCEPKSREARWDQQQRRRRRDRLLSVPEQRRELGKSGGIEGRGEVGFDEGGAEDEDDDDEYLDAATRDVFAAWGKRIRGEKAEKERERKRCLPRWPLREFQNALAGRPHSLPLDQLLECVSRFEILPPEVLSRELQAMGKAFSESVEGARRARELVRRWNQASPASRNACGPDDPEQEVWELVQGLTPQQRRSRARTIVARLQEEELSVSEETSASVSRGLFLAYMKNAHGGGGGRDGGVVSLERWLKDRQAAIRKARELEAGRERAQALSKADTHGRKALVSELKDELMRLVGSTKKTQKIDNAPGMEVLRSSRDGLDIHRRLKRLDAAAAEEDRARRALSSAEGGSGRRGDGGGGGGSGDGTKERASTGSGQSGDQQQPHAPPSPPLLLSKRAFNAEMGDILFSLTADGAAAARAKELAGVPLIAADLRKKWAKEGEGGGEDGLDVSQGRATATTKSRTTPSSLHQNGQAIGLPFAEELFGLKEAELLDRGKKDAEQKRELALQKYRDWSKEKSKEARKARRQQQAKEARDAEQERQRRAEGLRAYRRWLRLASKEAYFSAQSNKVVPRARLSPRVRSTSAPSARSSARIPPSCSGNTGDPAAGAALSGKGGRRCNEKDHRDGDGVGGGQTRRRRHQWNSSTEGAENVYSRAAKAGLPDFL